MNYLLAVILAAMGLGLSSCYGVMDASLNAAYLQSSYDNGSTTMVEETDTETVQSVTPRDTVYLKDGSIIHGLVIEETPGASLKIRTKAGNVYTYQMTDIAKITHHHAQSTDDNGANNGPDSAPVNNADNTSADQ